MGIDKYLTILTCVISIILCLCPHSLAMEINHIVQSNQDRSSKLFPLFSIVRVTNYVCLPEVPDATGTCFTKTQCNNAGGLASGSCANGFGVCCVVTATCDAVVTQNNTNFRNRDFPSSFNPSGLEICNIRIQKPAPNVCQLRLDFTSLELAAADAEGQCMTDRLSINGVTSAPTNLCGALTGQHMYLEFGSSDRITLSVVTDGAANSMSRNWNVKMAFIECNSVARAPAGCLQYYTEGTAQVKMLGYPMAPHLADLDYTVCVRGEDGSGSITWVPCAGEPALSSFLLSGAAATSATMLMPGATCNEDYVLILTDDTAGMTPKTNDRYCGSGLKAAAPQLVRSIGRPFIMRVRTNADEPDADVQNTGFCLSFRQEPPRRL